MSDIQNESMKPFEDKEQLLIFLDKEQLLIFLEEMQDWLNTILSIPLKGKVSSSFAELKDAVDLAAVTLSACLEDARQAATGDDNWLLITTLAKAGQQQETLLAIIQDVVAQN
jgi:hypothetical protein